MPFEAGKLTATASTATFHPENAKEPEINNTDNLDNNAVIRYTLQTFGAPVQLAMAVVSFEDIIQIEISVLDAFGRRVTTDQSRIDVRIDGDCEYLGLDNGDIRDITDYRATFRNALDGRLMLYLRKKEGSSVKVSIHNPYLRGCSMTV